MNAHEWMMAPTFPTEAAARRRFLVLSGLGALIYGAMWFFYTHPTYSHARLNQELFVWPVLALLLYQYRTIYNTVKSGFIPLPWLVGAGLLTAFIAVMVPAFHSTDLFGYINRGWQQLHYGMNPYVYTVDYIPNWGQDPMITNHWVDNPSPYGFLYLLTAKALCALGGGNKPTTVLVFKLFNLFIHAATGTLIWLGVSRLNPKADTPQKPAAAMRALCLYAFNPLILVHGLANGHNDLLMGFLATLAAYCAIAGAWLWIMPALVTSTLIKYGALVIIPFAVLFLIRNKAWASLLGGLALGALIFLATGAPYLADWQAFHVKEISRNAFVSHGSLHSLVYSSFRLITKSFLPSVYGHRETVRTVLKNILLASYGLFYVGLAVRRLRDREYTLSAWLQDALLVMAVLVGVVSLKFYPWYLGMFFPLALYLPEGHWLRRFVVLLSCAQMFSITLIGQAHMLNFLVMTALPMGWIVWQERRVKRSAVAPSPPTRLQTIL